MLVFGSPKQRYLLDGVTPQAGMDYAVEVFSACLPVLEETDTVLAVEPLDPGEGNFLNTAADAVQDHRAGRLAPLPAAVGLQGDVERTVLARRADRALSAAARPLPRQRSERQGPGFGQLDFHPILEALGRIDYRGWVSVEVFDYTPGVERLARESAEYLNAAWPIWRRRVGRRQDAQRLPPCSLSARACANR